MSLVLAASIARGKAPDERSEIRTRRVKDHADLSVGGDSVEEERPPAPHVRTRPMARHVVHRRNGEVDEYQELRDTEQLEPDFVTVTFPEGSLRSYHAENGLGGVGFEFAEAGILVLRFEDSDHLITAFAPTAWISVSGTALGDRGRRSSSGH
jgi:hypothetical protein